MYKIYNSVEILQDVDSAIKEKRPFSLLRGGDGTLGVFSVCFLNGFIKIGHWSTEPNNTNIQIRRRGKPIGEQLVKLLLDRVSIPWNRRIHFFQNTIQYLKDADYIDSFQNYSAGSIKVIGNQELAKNWDKILSGVGIDLTNKKFCDPRFNFFCMIKEQMNLFDIMKDRAVFCISNNKFPWLVQYSGAKSVNYFVISGNIKNIKGNGLYNQMNQINNTAIAANADLYLVGSGFVGRNICGVLRQNRKVVLDVGSLFDYWTGKRDDIPLPSIRKMIKFNPKTKCFHKLPGCTVEVL